MPLKITPLPPVDVLHERFEYVDGTLVYNKRVSNRIFKGDRAGYLNKGYHMVAIKRVPYLVHRIIWKMFNGVDPQGEIDHIDRNPSNNRIENLRVVDRSGNTTNQERVIRNGGPLSYTDENGKRVYTPLGLEKAARRGREKRRRNRDV